MNIKTFTFFLVVLILSFSTGFSQIQDNDISDDQTVCNNGFIFPLHGTQPTGGNGFYTYLWIMSSDKITWSPAPGQNDSIHYFVSFVPAGPDTIYFARIVYSGADVDTSNIVTIIVLGISAIVNNTISPDQDVCWDETPVDLTGTIPSGGGTITFYYQWLSADDPGFYYPYFPSGITDQQNYSFPGPLDHTTFFMRVVFIDSNMSVCPTPSNIVSINVTSVDDNFIQDNQEICSGSYPAVLTGTAPANPVIFSYNVLWEESTDSITFTPAAGTNNNLNYDPGQLFSDMYYRRTITASFNNGCTTQDSKSNVVFVKVNPAITNNQIIPQDTDFVCAGTHAKIISEQTLQGGNGSYSFHWQTSNDNVNWMPAPGNNAIEEYTTPLIQNPVYFRRITYSGGCTDISNSVYIQLDTNSVANNFIDINGMDSVMVCGGMPVGNINGTMPSGGNGIFEYYWKKTTDSINWFTINPPPYDQQSYYYGEIDSLTYFMRVVVSGTCTSESNIFTAAVAGVTNNYIYDNQFYCTPSFADSLIGPEPPLLPAASVQYLWEQSQDSLNWFPANGTNSEKNYYPGFVSTTTFYRRTVADLSGTCSGAINVSNTVVIGIAEPIGNNIIYTVNANICFNEQALLGPNILDPDPVGGDGIYTFLWQDSIAGGSWQDAPGTNNAYIYQSPGLTQQTFYRRIVFSCGFSDTSNIIAINILPQPAYSFSINDSICITDGAEFQIDYTGNLPYYIVYDDGFVTDTLGPIDQAHYVDYFTPTQTSNLTVHEVFDDNGCSAGNPSQTYQIVVFPEIVANAGNDTVICNLQTENGLHPVLNSASNTGYWTTTDNIVILEPNNPNTNVIAPEYGDYNIVWHEENERCSGTDELFITFINPPDTLKNYAGENQNLDYIPNTFLNAQDVPGYAGSWSVIYGPAIIEDVFNPSAFVYNLQVGDNIFTWTLHNDFCPDKTDTVIINLNNKIIIPSGFSPNGDGANDYFVIKGLLPDFNPKLSIFDRWGNLVISFIDYNNTWNGKDENGNDLIDDTYYYILDLNDSKDIYKGFVVIKR
ncbi:MAG: hypothetical protein Kow0068_18070 [Marinilabiliales bacterium]